MKKKLAVLLMVLTLSQCLMACGGGSDYSGSSSSSMENDYESSEMVTSTDSSVMAEENVQKDENRKLIRDVYLRVETKEYDGTIANLEKKVKQYHGYIENMSTYNHSYDSEITASRNASYIIRIPAESLDAFVNEVGDKVNVLEHTENVKDVTLNYVDMDSHVRMLKEEQERLMNFLEEAQSIEEIITIEQRLSEVKYQIESMSSQLKTIDNQVDYATITIDVEEVAQLTPVQKQTVGQRISTGFVESMIDVREKLVAFFVWFVSHIPYFVVWAIIGLIVWGIIALSNKVSKKYGKKRNHQANTKVNPSAIYTRPGQSEKKEEVNEEKNER